MLVDTNVLSELRKREAVRDPGVKAWERETDLAAVHLSAITVSELATWVDLVARRDSGQGAVIEEWFRNRVLALFGPRILPVDSAVAIRAGALHVPDPRDYRDAFIAATALVHGLTVVTRNVSHFAAMGVPLINPFA
jgi:predicted nucleic acid-binding protein